MRVLVLLSTLLIASMSYAENASDSLANFDHQVYASLGFTPGGIAFAGEYEYPYHRTFGMGAYLRSQSKDDQVGNGQGVMAIGAFVRPHFHRRAWDLYVAPGFGIFMVDAAEDETALGPSLDIGLMYQMKENFALGIEHFVGVGWFADDWKGQQIINNIFLKGRLGF